MGEKDHSDKQLVGDGGADLRAARDDRARAREVERSDRARGAPRRHLPHQHALHDHERRLGPHRIELQLHRSDHLALDRRARRSEQRRAPAPTPTSRRRATTRRRCTRCSSRSRSSTSTCCTGCGASADCPAIRTSTRRSSRPTPARSGWASRRPTAWRARSRFARRGGRIVVMTGDGELQEGQIWESLQPVANERLAEIIVIVDHNKLQSDSAVAAVSDLGPIEDKFRAFGWEVRRVDGHDFGAIRDVVRALRDASPTGRRCSSPTRSRARACRSWKVSRAATRPITSTPARRR